MSSNMVLFITPWVFIQIMWSQIFCKGNRCMLDMITRTMDVITPHQVHLSKTAKHWDGFVSHCIYLLVGFWVDLLRSAQIWWGTEKYCLPELNIFLTQTYHWYHPWHNPHPSHDPHQTCCHKYDFDLTITGLCVNHRIFRSINQTLGLVTQSIWLYCIR